MRTSKLLLVLSLLLSIPAAAQVTDTYVIPAAANQAGASGTRWMTFFSLFNPHFDYPLVISVTYLSTGGTVGYEELIKVPPNSLAYSDNILDALFDVQGGGSLLVAAFKEDNPGVPDTIIDRAFLVTSNTYNNARTGTYGQTIPGVWTGLLDYDYDGISAIAQGIRHSARDGWRTNVGALNLGRCAVTLRVSVYDADGNTKLNAAPLVVPPLGHIQDRLPVEVEAGSVEFWVDDPCTNSNTDYAVVFPYTSTIDALSGDPTYQSPALLASPGSIFAKSFAKAANFDPLKVGKKIDSAIALGVRERVQRLGMAKLERDAKGWRITR